jgi:protein-S-isoprenylcysteine O-methyltransferase Ste14
VSAPLLLGSAWAWIPAALCAVGVVVRTALEDRTLRRELEGYDEYARRVPFRLVPGIW